MNVESPARKGEAVEIGANYLILLDRLFQSLYFGNQSTDFGGKNPFASIA